MIKRVERVAAWLRRALRREPLGVLSIVLAAIATFRSNVSNWFLPGWDFHYHLMSAAIAARQWTGDHVLRSTYRFVNPLDANTLYYTLLFPLNLVGDPVFAARVGTTLFYFVGYPVACAVALRIANRPIWGAILAFATVHVWSMTYGGFMHFAVAAPFFVLSFALMDRVLEKPTRRTMIACALTCTLTFLAHAQVYGWMLGVLGLLTLIRVARQLGPTVVFAPRSAVVDAVKIGLRASAVVGPSVVLLAIWYYRTRYGEIAAGGALTPRSFTWAERYTQLASYLTFTRADDEFRYLLFLPLVCIACWLLSGRLRGKTIPFEIAFLLTAASYLFLPISASGQVIAPRHLDMAMWLLPLVVYPARPAERSRRVVIVGVLAVFTYLRCAFFTEQLRALQTEYAGLIAILKSCPQEDKAASKRPFVAYMSMGMEPRAFHTPSVHQSHETLAAMCSMETPVYDALLYPHNLIPLRYRGPLPAPITILVSDPQWYAHPGIWQSYDYVLVHGWTPSAAARSEAEKVAVPVRSEGAWTLWHRR